MVAGPQRNDTSAMAIVLKDNRAPVFLQILYKDYFNDYYF